MLFTISFAVFHSVPNFKHTFKHWNQYFSSITTMRSLFFLVCSFTSQFQERWHTISLSFNVISALTNCTMILTPSFIYPRSQNLISRLRFSVGCLHKKLLQCLVKNILDFCAGDKIITTYVFVRLSYSMMEVRALASMSACSFIIYSRHQFCFWGDS